MENIISWDKFLLHGPSDAKKRKMIKNFLLPSFSFCDALGEDAHWSTRTWTCSSGGSPSTCCVLLERRRYDALSRRTQSEGAAWPAIHVSFYAPYSAVECLIPLALALPHPYWSSGDKYSLPPPYRCFSLPFCVCFGWANTTVFWRTLSGHHDLILPAALDSHPLCWWPSQADLKSLGGLVRRFLMVKITGNW